MKTTQLLNIFAPESTPASAIVDLSTLVLSITAVIFVVVAGLLIYAIVKFRATPANADREPAQVYGSTQIELAWTVVPVLIVLVLFAATARVIHAIQDAPQPPTAVEVTVIGHQFWWEYRYPTLGVVTANELHIPVSDASGPRPTFLTLLSADTDHSFWIPQLAGKTDLIPNRVNHLWMDPRRPGIFLGQVLQADAQPAATHLAGRPQPQVDIAGDLAGDGKADPLEGFANDRRGNADDLALPAGKAERLAADAFTCSSGWGRYGRRSGPLPFLAASSSPTEHRCWLSAWTRPGV